MNVEAFREDEVFPFDQLALERAVRALCSVGIRRTPLSKERVKTWVNQFESEAEKTLAWLLLRHLVYRTTPQLESSLRQALKQATLHFLQTAGADTSSVASWQDALAGKVSGLNFYCGPPMSRWFTQPGKSGDIVTRWVNRTYHVRKSSPNDVTQLTPDERYLVVDDGTYTGQLLIEFLENWGVDYSQGQVAVVVGLAHQTAIDTLKSNFPNVLIFNGELLTQKNGLSWLSTRWMADGQWPYEGSPSQTYLELCKRKGPFSKEIAEGYGSLGLMVAFEHGIPDDSLQLLWDRSEQWTPLIER